MNFDSKFNESTEVSGLQFSTNRYCTRLWHVHGMQLIWLCQYFELSKLFI